MANHPMVGVSWYGAVAYCNWRSEQEGRETCYDLSNWTCDFSKKGFRLSTEAEWEYAARGGLSGKRFPWGNNITHSTANYQSNNLCWYDTSSTRGYHPVWNDGILPYTSPVGSFEDNEYGLFDMTGNVCEWCNDWYSDIGYYSSPQANPTGPATVMEQRVLRGGNYDDNAAYRCRVSYRHFGQPGNRDGGNGFRIVLGL
jgi:formylglycine-generating enzyme required for sulfatase activity